MMQILEENLEITPQAPWRWTEAICWISEAVKSSILVLFITSYFMK